MVNEYEIKKQICDIGKRIYDKGMVASNDGNISVKIGENEFLCTPTGVSKGFMTPDYICKVDGDGKVISATGNFRPSSEIKMHMRVYKNRPDVQAVVHAHPIYATSFAIAGVPIADYGTPSTEEIPDAVEKYLQHFDAVLLANHGALSFSDSLLSAYHKMESVEFYAQLLYQSKQLGGPKELSKDQVKRLYEVRRAFGMTGKHPADICLNAKAGVQSCHNCHQGVEESACAGSCSDAELIAQITKKVMESLGK